MVKEIELVDGLSNVFFCRSRITSYKLALKSSRIILMMLYIIVKLNIFIIEYNIYIMGAKNILVIGIICLFILLIFGVIEINRVENSFDIKI